ncbi:MAG: polysaccharide biosynthesis protein [Puniceicoccales bacterium]
MNLSPRLEEGVRRTWIAHWASLIFVAFGSLYLAYQLRFEFQLPIEPTNWQLRMWETMSWILPFELIIFYSFGLFTPLVARLRFMDLMRILTCVGLITAFLAYTWFIFSGNETPPRSVIVINAILLTMGLLAIGSVSGQLRTIITGKLSELPVRAQRIVVVGEGYLAYQLIKLCREQPGLSARVVGLVTTNGGRGASGLWHGVPIGGKISAVEFIARRFDPDRIVVTDPELDTEQLRELIQAARRLRVPVQIVPTAQEMFYGILQMSAIRPVSLDDILGRAALDTNLPKINHLLSGKSILVTGAGGSIGSELCRQILVYGPSKLLLLDSSEPSLFAIEQELKALPFGDRVHPVLVNVRDRGPLAAVIDRERPDLIFHSAALKHVPMVESFPAEGLLTNTLATDQLAELAEEFGVERMVFISSDKAINPTSLMGASKRFAEQLIQARSGNGSTTEFIAVRFGNVISSSGSVVPTFERQIAAGGPVTVTHRDVERYFMSIPEAVGLVLQSASQGSGGEIFMLDMGQPLKVIDVARQMIELRGLQPDVDIEIKIIGLRPGEKLFEELRYDAEIHAPTSHPRVYRLTGKPLSPSEANELRQRITELSRLTDRDAVRKAVKELLPEFIEESGPSIAQR